MAVSPVSSLDSLVDVVTIGIVLLALYYVVHQRLNRTFDAKTSLVIVYLAFLGGMLLELLRDFTADPAAITGYTFGEIGFILLIVMLLTWVAYTFYVRPSQPRFGGRLRALFSPQSRPHGVVITLVVVYFIFLEVYLVAARPFTILDVTTASGTIAAPRFDTGYLVLLSVVLLVYVVYSLPLFVRAGRKAQNRDVRRALLVLPLSWTAVGAELLLFNGLFLEADLNIIVIGHLALAATFAITAVVFMNLGLLGSIFEPIGQRSQPSFATSPFTDALGIVASPTEGSSMLLEVDPSTSYQTGVKDFVVEQLSKHHWVFVFTFAGSPVLSALSDLPEVRFYLATASVTYTQPTEEPNKILFPPNRGKVVLDLTEQILLSNPGKEDALVFDNISDRIVSNGYEETIELLGRMLKIVDRGGMTSLFLMTTKGHDERVMMSVRRLFDRRLVYDSGGSSGIEVTSSFL